MHATETFLPTSLPIDCLFYLFGWWFSSPFSLKLRFPHMSEEKNPLIYCITCMADKPCCLWAGGEGFFPHQEHWSPSFLACQGNIATFSSNHIWQPKTCANEASLPTGSTKAYLLSPAHNKKPNPGSSIKWRRGRWWRWSFTESITALSSWSYMSYMSYMSFCHQPI